MSANVAELVAAVPIVAARDVPLAVAWYCDHLGFAPEHVEREYGFVRRGPLQLRFTRTRETPRSMLRIDVDGIDELYDECRRRGIVRADARLEVKPWGAREFAIVDRDGNLLTFSEAVDGRTPLERELPALAQVLGGYLHQDFDADFDCADAALAAVADEAPLQAAAAADEIDALLASPRTDAQLVRLVERLTTGYSPVLDGWEIRRWLEHARAILRGAS